MSMTRDELRSSIQEAIAHDRKVGSPSIRVTFAQERAMPPTVQLLGEVPNLLAKQRVAEIAEELAVGYAVENDLVITSGGHVLDAALEKLAQRLLAADSMIPPSLGVKIDRGTARLVGSAKSLAQIERAEELISQIAGIKEIWDRDVTTLECVNLLSPQADLKTSQDSLSLSNRVEQRLADVNPALAGAISTMVIEGVAVMRGYLRNQQEIRQVLATGVATPGIKGVKSLIVALDGSTGGDEALEERIRHALGAPRDSASPVDIKVAVIDGISFLFGQADTLEGKEEAGRIAKQQPGIRYVMNDVIIVTRHPHPEKKRRSG